MSTDWAKEINDLIFTLGSVHEGLGSNPSNTEQTAKQLVAICCPPPTPEVMGMAEIISLFSRNAQIIHDQLRSTCKSVCPLHATCLLRSTCFRTSPPSISLYPVIQVQVLLGVPAPWSSTPLPHSFHTSLSWEAGHWGSLRSNLS